MNKTQDWEVHMNNAQRILDETLESITPQEVCDMCEKVECSCDDDYQDSLEY